jgi:Excalibur calcium-binding domain/Protein of unknown function (DUF1524)
VEEVVKIKGVVIGVVALVALGQFLGDAESDAEAGTATEAPPTAPPTATADSGRTNDPSVAPNSPPRDAAAAALALLPVKGRAPMTGYDRARFGPAWLDADRNGCDTRNDVLAEYLVDVERETNGCVVTAGTYAEPYTGRPVDFVRGGGTLLDIDHVVAMGNAWATGAFGWDIRKRAAFANDPLNLLPADASANRQKGDGDAATWLPSYQPFRCEYVARQVSVKAKYGLWVTAPEAAAVSRVLDACPAQGLVPDTWGAATAVDHQLSETPAATHAAEPEAAVTPPVAQPSPVWFDNCDAARAAGAAPVHVGDPGYGRHLDRDGDGSGCE